MQFELMAKDYIRLYFLNEVLHTKTTEFYLYIEIEDSETNFLDIKSGIGVYRFNNFNIAEDITSNCITFRPIIVGCYTYFRIDGNTPTIVEIVRNGSGNVSETFTLSEGESKLVLVPQGSKKYIVTVSDENIKAEKKMRPTLKAEKEIRPAPKAEGLDSFSGRHKVQEDTEEKVTSDSGQCHTDQLHKEQLYKEQLHTEINSRHRAEIDNASLNKDIEELKEQIEALEQSNRLLEEKRQNLKDTLVKMKDEYDKNYAGYESELKELQSRYAVDKEILLMYSDSKVMPIEELLARAETAVTRVEEQVRLLIAAKQKKTAQIEDELQIGRKE